MGKLIIAGCVNRDANWRLPRFPAAGEEVQASSYTLVDGGKGLNQAIAAARAGAEVALISAVGNDENGRHLRHRLREEGVDETAVRTVSGTPTGYANVMVDPNAENRIIYVNGANDRTTLPPELAVATDDIVLGQFDIPVREVTIPLFRKARAVRATTVFNAAPADALDDELFELTDILIVNAFELRRFVDFQRGWGETSSGPDNPADAERMLRTIAMLPNQTIIVTLGAAGVLSRTNGRTSLFRTPSVEAVDTGGAGDTFVGNFCARYGETKNLHRSIRFAVEAAALSVTRPGAATASPTRAEVDAFHAQTLRAA